MLKELGSWKGGNPIIKLSDYLPPGVKYLRVQAKLLSCNQKNFGEIYVMSMINEKTVVYSIDEPKTSDIQVRQPDKNKSEDSQLDLFGPTSVPAETAKIQRNDNFSIQYKQVEVSTFNVGIDKVQSAADVAHIIAPIRKHAQETILAVVADNTGKVINVIRHTKGTKDASNVSIVELVSAIGATDKAAKVWFAHNHPSGIVDPSGADQRVTGALNKALKERYAKKTEETDESQFQAPMVASE